MYTEIIRQFFKRQYCSFDILLVFVANILMSPGGRRLQRRWRLRVGAPADGRTARCGRAGAPRWTGRPSRGDLGTAEGGQLCAEGAHPSSSQAKLERHALWKHAQVRREY